MKVKERFATQPGIGENESFVSPPPIFNIERLKKVNGIADEWLTKERASDFSALGIALRLGLYNGSSAQPIDSDTSEVFFKRFKSLAQKEASFANPNNPFPTIGVEIEVPRKIVTAKDLNTYAVFFDKVGMPRNKVNNFDSSWGESWGSYWEFSPHPAYYAGTQARIISELIHGGFIPSLQFSQNPEDVKQYLDEKLVSLHVNLGIFESPSTISTSDHNCVTFSNMVSLAFTSALRLQLRESHNSFSIKAGKETLKNTGLGSLAFHRLELKAHEVRTESTYRLLKETQLLGGALFAFLCEGDPWLSQMWQGVSEKAESLIKKVFAGTTPLSHEAKALVAKRVEETAIQKDLRSLITRTAIEIAKRYGV